MAAISINIQGTDILMNSVNKKKEEIEEILNREFQVFGNNTTTLAKRLAPFDEGKLKGSIGYQTQNLKVEITVGADYAAYLEFGTKSFAAIHVATLPLEWQVFAAQFKGRSGSGSFQDFVMRLTRWVLIKNIGATFNIKTKKQDKVGTQSKQTTAESIAYAIALSIIRNGIKPHPYFVPAVEKNKIILIENLKKALK